MSTSSSRLPIALTALLLAALLSLVAATPAQAGFPGTNGKIVFGSTRDGPSEVYVVNPDGTGQTNLTNNAAEDYGPAWSPNGTRIVFASDRNAAGFGDVFVMNADGSSPLRLTTNTVDDTDWWQPSVSLDRDRDGVVGAFDTCTLVSNPTLLDADHDGYGNACDADLNNSGLVTTADFGLLRSVLNQAAGSSATAAAADLNGSGTVTTADFAILRAWLNTAPGPSGLACAGTVPCP